MDTKINGVDDLSLFTFSSVALVDSDESRVLSSRLSFQPRLSTALNCSLGRPKIMSAAWATMSWAKSEAFSGKMVFITGASRGLGLEFADQLASNGAIVFASCRSPEKAEGLKELQQRYPGTVEIWQYDTTMPRDLRERILKLDILINNAGIVTTGHPEDAIVTSDVAELERLMQTNLVGTMATTNGFLQALRRGTSKMVVNISSDLASITHAQAGVASYRITKAALNMATRIYAAELKSDDIKVVALSPGWVATDMGSQGNRSPPLTPQDSVSGCLRVLANLSPADSGKFLRYDGSEIPW